MPLKVKNDNQSAIAICKNDVLHQRVRHIDIRHHFIREHIHNKSIKIEYVQTGKQLADILTKAVKTTVFKNLVNLISKETDIKPLSIKEGV